MSDKKITVESGKTYLGVVEDNQDPDRLGRCRVRVTDVHDGQDKDGNFLVKTETLPWALPWKDLNGNANNIPDKGKIVLIVFENGKPMNPQYICSNHYNINLEKKMKSLGDKDYLTMKSLIFDHKTQIYVNDTEGLKIDHKFNNINITNESIDINLKDNFGKINIGTARSEQRAILGDNFTEWFDKFLNLMLTNQAFIGNFAAPIVPSPKLMKHIQLYKSIKDPKILSKNVFIVDNEYVQKIDRIADPTLGDNWQSTVQENKITKTEKIDYYSQPGASSTTFPGTEPKDGKANGGGEPDKEQLAKSALTNEDKKTPVKKDIHPDVKILTRLLTNKNYTVYDKPNQINIVAVRNQCLVPKSAYTDEFVDKLYVMYKTDQDEWDITKFNFSTVPGTEFTLTEELIAGKIKDSKTEEYVRNWYLGTKMSTKKYYKTLGINEGIPVLVPSQYVDSFEMVSGGTLRSRDGAQNLIWYDKSFDRPDFVPENMPKPEKSSRAFYITKGYPGGKKVGHWGLEGDQCFSSAKDLETFMTLCDKHQQAYGNSFTYTLATKDDWENATVQESANSMTPDPAIAAATANAKDVVAKKEPPKRPSELSDDKKLIAYQIWANKNGKKLAEDGKWGQQTNDAWTSQKAGFLKYIGHVKDSDIWLGFARLFPYGGTVNIGNDNYMFKSKFNNNKYSILLTDGKAFSIFNEKTNSLFLKGKYENGCTTLVVTDGYNKGKTFKDDNAWDNIRKSIV